jgi:hypothetical protein
MGETMSVEVRGKSQVIQDLVDSVMRSPVGVRLNVVDHWEADAEAVGFAGRSRTGLVYVSTFHQPAGVLFWSVESPSGAMIGESTGDEDALIAVLDEAFPDAGSRAV